MWEEEMSTQVKDLIQTIQQLPRPEKQLVIESVLKSLQKTASEVQSLADLRARYAGEWLAVAIPEGEDLYNPQRGRLVVHSQDRSFVWQQIDALAQGEDVYVFYNGPVAAKGFGIVFHDTTDTPVVATVGD